MLNIPSNLKETNYIWKMPALICNNRGTNTKLQNISTISHYLRVPTECLMNFLSSYLGSTILNQNDEEYLIKGNFKTEELQELIDM
jgi:translation initiation factor 2 beta subunit (eIF-2beta)/eIF-5